MMSDPALGLLMLALYRTGRQADALRAFQDGRRHLAEELGLEPGRNLLSALPGGAPPMAPSLFAKKSMTPLLAAPTPEAAIVLWPQPWPRPGNASYSARTPIRGPSGPSPPLSRPRTAVARFRWPLSHALQHSRSAYPESPSAPASARPAPGRHAGLRRAERHG